MLMTYQARDFWSFLIGQFLYKKFYPLCTLPHPVCFPVHSRIKKLHAY